jgi:predicted dehydrogenase
VASIRLGVIRCDPHAYTFIPLLAECDMERLRQACPQEFYFLIDPYNWQALKYPRVEGFEVVKVWDADREEAVTFSQVFLGRPQVCTTLEEMTEGIDAVFINDCNGDGSDHLELSRPFLQKGIPTFVDKPFASTLRDARAMVALARQHDAPLFSASILSFVDEIQFLRRRLPEVHGPISLGIVKGVGADGQLAAVIHGLSLAQGVFGTGVEWVECIGALKLQYILLHYQSGVEVLVINSDIETHGYFYCDLYTRCRQPHPRWTTPPRPGHLRANPMGDPEFVVGATNILRAFKRMIETRQPPVPYETLLELIAIVEAAREAQEKRRRVYLKDWLEREE